MARKQKKVEKVAKATLSSITPASMSEPAVATIKVTPEDFTVSEFDPVAVSALAQPETVEAVPPPTPAPGTTPVTRVLELYRARVRVSNDANDPVKAYYCWAPTQCAATKWIALQSEVEDFLMIELLQSTFAIPSNATLLSTEKDCGEFSVGEEEAAA